MLYVPKAQGSLPPGPHALYVRCTRTGRGTTGEGKQLEMKEAIEAVNIAHDADAKRNDERFAQQGADLQASIAAAKVDAMLSSKVTEADIAQWAGNYVETSRPEASA